MTNNNDENKNEKIDQSKELFKGNKSPLKTSNKSPQKNNNSVEIKKLNINNSNFNKNKFFNKSSLNKSSLNKSSLNKSSLNKSSLNRLIKTLKYPPLIKKLHKLYISLETITNFNKSKNLKTIFHHIKDSLQRILKFNVTEKMIDQLQFMQCINTNYVWLDEINIKTFTIELIENRVYDFYEMHKDLDIEKFIDENFNNDINDNNDKNSNAENDDIKNDNNDKNVNNKNDNNKNDDDIKNNNNDKNVNNGNNKNDINNLINHKETSKQQLSASERTQKIIQKIKERELLRKQKFIDDCRLQEENLKLKEKIKLIIESENDNNKNNNSNKNTNDDNYTNDDNTNNNNDDNCINNNTSCIKLESLILRLKIFNAKERIKNICDDKLFIEIVNGDEYLFLRNA
ncbi:hypothetical protein DMUE_3676 [Dictyocoela muelleri]|nr:hypothetical protein DMUE_3676 [Dictyocoela muelleri]